ncbi:MAG: hypothetical protein K6G07_01525 [Lachnospiraceae bacterium]|nr:hypothetical protein [Lachnospiraceae bacterium]
MTAQEYKELKLNEKTTVCSAVLYPDGDIKECVKSHLKTMIHTLGNDIWDEIPKDEAPLFWLTAYMGVVLIDYENQLYSEELTPEQERALRILYDADVIMEKPANIHYGNRYLGIARES